MQIARNFRKMPSITSFHLFTIGAWILSALFAASVSSDLDVTPRLAINQVYKDENKPVTSDAAVKQNIFRFAEQNENEISKILQNNFYSKNDPSVEITEDLHESNNYWNHKTTSADVFDLNNKNDMGRTDGNNRSKGDTGHAAPMHTEEPIWKNFQEIEIENYCQAWYEKKTAMNAKLFYSNWILYYIGKLPQYPRLLLLGISVRWIENILPMADFAVHKFSTYVSQAILFVEQCHLRLSSKRPYIWNTLLTIFSFLLVARLLFGKFWPFTTSRTKQKYILRKDAEFIENMVKRINWLCERAATTVEKEDTATRMDLGGLLEELAIIKNAFDIRERQLSDLNFQMQQLGAFMYLHTAVVTKCFDSQPERESSHMRASIPEVENFVIGGTKMSKEFHSWCSDSIKPIVANWLQPREELHVLDNESSDVNMLDHLGVTKLYDGHNETLYNQNVCAPLETETFMDTRAQNNVPISTYGIDEKDGVFSTQSPLPSFYFVEPIHEMESVSPAQTVSHRTTQKIIGESIASQERLETQALKQFESPKFPSKEPSDAENAHNRLASSEMFVEDLKEKNDSKFVPSIVESFQPPTSKSPFNDDQSPDTRILGHNAPMVSNVSLTIKEKPLPSPLRYTASKKEYSKIDAHTDPFSVKLRNNAQTSS